MDMILRDVMGGQVSHRSHWVGFAANLDLVALHGLLDRGANIADTHINAGSLQGWSAFGVPSVVPESSVP